MAPEQRGDLAVPVSTATDVYAFGVMLYRLLTGRRPAGMAKPVTQVVKGISKRWDAVCARCLEHDPEDRYADGGELAKALGGQLRNTRHALKLIPGLAAALAVGAGVYLGLPAYREHQARRAAETEAAREAAAQDAATRAKTTDLTRRIETSLTAGELGEAGRVLVELEAVGGTTSVSSALRQRYEGLAGERETNRRYAEASVARDAAMKIERGQTLGERLDQLEVTWREAEAARQGGSWGQALTGYDGVLAQSRELRRLDELRSTAETKRSKMEAARRNAAGGNAAGRSNLRAGR